MKKLSYTAEIRFSYDALMPDDPIGLIENDERVIMLTGEADISENETVIGRINGVVLLSAENENPLIIHDFKWNDTTLRIEKRNGNLWIQDVCVDSLRKIKLFTLTSLSIIPNPTEDELELIYEDERKGTVDIAIYNVQGEKQFFISNIQKTGIKLEYTLNATDLPAGVYILNLRCGSNFMARKFFIVK